MIFRETYDLEVVVNGQKHSTLTGCSERTRNSSALFLTGGKTIHSRLKVPTFLNELSVCSITKYSALANLIQITMQ